MATPVAEIEFIPDEQVDFIPDDAPAADAIDFVPDEVVAEEAQRATTGAVQALDVMAAPRAFDWSEVNEQMDQERFREAEGLRAQGQPEQAVALLNEITPFTTAGQYVAQQRAGEAQGAAEAAATQARGGATPSEALRRGLGPGLSATVQPVVESGLRNVGAAAGGALAAAKLSPTPIGLASRLSTALGIALPIGGSVMGAIAGGSAQEALMQIGETPEETQRRQQLAAEAAARDPGLTKLGGAVATLPFFGPSLAQFGRAAAGDVGAATNIALSGTIGAGVEVGGALLRGDTMSARNIAEAFALNAFLNEPTKLGRKLGLKPSSEQQAVEDATIKNEQPPIPIGPTSEVGVVAGMRQAPSAIPRKTAVAETPVVETPVAKPTETDAKISESLFPTDELALRGTEPVSGESVTRVRERKNDKGETVYVIEHGNGQVGYSDNPIWGLHSKFTETPTPAPETPATRTDEQRIAELVAAGMTPEEAAAGVARAKAAEVPPVAETPVAETPPPAEPPITPEAPQPIGPEPTSNKESVVNAERAQRALDPVIKEAAIENPEVVGYAEDVIAADPERPQRIIDRLRAAPPEERTISLVDGGILLIERTKLRARRDAALARASRKEGSAMEQAIAQAEFDAAEGQLNAMDQAAQDARSTWGRFGQFWQRSMREDFSLANLERRARLSKDGPLTEKDIKGITAIAEKAKAAHEAFDIRQKQLELESRQSAIEAKIAEVSGKDIPAPIMQRFRDYMQRLSVAADFQAKKAEEALRAAFEKSQRLGAVPNAPDPILGHVIDLAFAKVVKGAADFGGWSAEMVSKWGSRIEPYLQNAWAAATAKAESSVDRFTGDKKKRAAIKAAAKVPLNAAAQQARIETAIGERIKESKPLSSLAPYVNKLQESFIAQGITQREPLIDAVHGALQKHDPAITRDDAMEIMSKYGSDYATPLSKDPVKQTRRQVDGEIQQLLKLRDIAAKVPLPKSGPERPTPGPTWRNLIKQVNAAKKKLGVVVTDPETQLKSSQDAIRTRLRNDIEDMTLELETGERPPEKTPAEYTQDMEILKGVRDRVRETLRSIDENPQLTDEQRLALTKRSAEESLALWERRLAGETAKAPKQRITSPEIEAIRAKRDAIKAEVEELNAADAVLQENRKAEALVRQIEATEAQLASNAQRVKAQGADSQLVAEAREQLAAVRAALDTKRANDPLRQAEAIEKAEQALEASIKKLDADLQAGNIATRTKPTRLESDRLIYLRAQRDALNQLRAQLRAEARPRIAADQLAIKMRTTQMLKRAAELRRRIAAGDFGPRTRKAPVDISGDRAALDAQADLMSVDAEFQKLQEQWKLDQLTWPQQVLRRAGQAWDASANIFLSFDLSTPLQTAFAMAAHPVTGAKAVGKGAKAFYEQFIKSSDAYAAREAARIANSTNAKNGLYKAMKLELPSALGKKREENMVNVLEQLAELDARWAGLPDVVKGLFKLEGKTLLRGGKRLASVIPKVAGSGIKASNSAFETIANTMRARTADAMLARWYGRGRGTPTKQQLELLGEQVNIATGKGGLRSGDSVRRLLFAPNYYLSIIKQLSGYQLGKAAVRLEGQVTKDIATEYVRAVATMGALYGLNMLFGNEVEWDARSKEFGRPKTDRGTAIDLTMGRGAWITAGAQIATGERIQNGKIKDADRKGTALAFAGGRLSRGVATALTSAFGEDYRGKPIEGIEILKDFVIPLGWRNFDDVLRKEGFTRGSFIQLLNILGVTHNVHE